jgi:hypothetical protein
MAVPWYESMRERAIGLTQPWSFASFLAITVQHMGHGMFQCIIVLEPPCPTALDIILADNNLEDGSRNFPI